MYNKKLFLITFLALVILLGINYLLNQSNYLIKNTTLNNKSLGGAAQYQGKLDVKNSPYFPQIDIYNLKPNDHLLILTNYPTIQQNTFYTCGPAAANTVVKYYMKNILHSEAEVGKYMSTNSTNGTSLKGMLAYFKYLNWEVKSTINNPTPETYNDFIKFVKYNLKNNLPIIVENVDWGGHWRVIIGYDSMNTQNTHDDILILADPFDTSDHLQDGYNIISAERFFYMWFDHQLYPKNEQQKLWLTAKPR